MKFLVAALIALPVVLYPWSVSAQTGVTSGFISDVVVGEIDPEYVGDACLIYVETDEDETLGLVADFDACLNETKFDVESLVGTQVWLSNANFTAVRRGSYLSTLKGFRSDATYLKVKDTDQLIYQIRHNWQGW